MNKSIVYNIFIWTFVILYACTALISCIHAIDFFSIGNVSWMSILLACVFEIGQATVLASLLLSENKNNIMPWCLMIILTTVQVIGNVYSCFKYISLSDVNYYQYLEKPLLFWVNGISEETVMIIISYIIGALLPIVALCMTTMVANNLKFKNETTNNKHKSDEVAEQKELQNDLKTDTSTLSGWITINADNPHSAFSISNPSHAIEIDAPDTEEIKKQIEESKKLNIKDVELKDVSVQQINNSSTQDINQNKHRIRSVEFNDEY